MPKGLSNRGFSEDSEIRKQRLEYEYQLGRQKKLGEAQAEIELEESYLEYERIQEEEQKVKNCKRTRLITCFGIFAIFFLSAFSGKIGIEFIVISVVAVIVTLFLIKGLKKKKVKTSIFEGIVVNGMNTLQIKIKNKMGGSDASK